MTDDNDVYTPAQYREHLEGHGSRSPHAPPHAGTVQDPLVSRYMAVLSEQYDPTAYADAPARLPGRAEDLREMRRLRAIAAAETGREAMRDGDMPTLKHLTGNTNEQVDVSGLKAIEALVEMVTGPAAMFYLWAEPGSGKTNFALLLAQLWKRERGGDALLASNVRTLRETDAWVDREDRERDGWLSSFGELEEWIEQDGDPLRNDQRPKLFIFDEASSSAGGSGSAGYETKQKMGPLAYKIRKYGGALVVIGHDGKDVHPLIRELGTAVHKESKKKATFYDDVKNRSGVGEIVSVEGIPPTDYRYDDKEPTAWSWDRGGDEADEPTPAEVERELLVGLTVAKREAGCSTREVAEFVGMSTGWVSERWGEYNDDGQHRDAVNRYREAIG